MNPRKRKPIDLSQLRGDIDADDGADPRQFFQKKTRPSRQGRKTHQLSAQVADALSHLFGGESGDEVLQQLRVIDVSPAPDASQLQVLVGPVVSGNELSAAEVAAALDRASGWLRTEVATAITRKRTPRLLFRYLPLAPGEEVTP